MMKVKYGDMTVNTREVYVNTWDSIIVHDRAHTYFFVFFLSYCIVCKNVLKVMFGKNFLPFTNSMKKGI